MNDLTMCLKWKASGAFTTVRRHLSLLVPQMKLKANRRLRKWQHCGDSPELHFDGHGGLSLLLTSVGKLGLTPTTPTSPSSTPQFCWGLISAGQTQGVWWQNSGDDRRTALHISRAKAGCFPRRPVSPRAASIRGPPKVNPTGAILGRTSPGISGRKSITSCKAGAASDNRYIKSILFLNPCPLKRSANGKSSLWIGHSDTRANWGFFCQINVLG